MSPGPDFRGADRERCVSYFTLLWWSKNTLSTVTNDLCVVAGSSGGPLLPSPPAEKATACQDQTGKFGTGDGTKNRQWPPWQRRTNVWRSSTSPRTGDEATKKRRSYRQRGAISRAAELRERPGCEPLFERAFLRWPSHAALRRARRH